MTSLLILWGQHPSHAPRWTRLDRRQDRATLDALRAAGWSLLQLMPGVSPPRPDQSDADAAHERITALFGEIHQPFNLVSETHADRAKREAREDAAEKKRQAAQERQWQEQVRTQPSLF